MLYLKYRPHTVAELDNSRVRDVIKNILGTKNLPHAFLFTGQKGTGKTSTARIVAKAINCLNNAFAGKGTSIEPCNSCVNCLNIGAGSSPDVLEMDAASNRGIEEVRSLIRDASFAPMTSSKRVFIIDEAHMITNDAFNALLKTLEEPPESVIFILATTNEEKIPKTITSRCLQVRFGEASRQDVKTKLQKIAVAEKMNISEEVIDLITKYSDRSFRDAIKLLEELYLQKKLNVNDVKDYLGVRSKLGLLEILEQKDSKKALAWVEDFIANGGNIKYLIETVLEELRLLLLVKSGLKTDEERSTTLSIVEITFLMKSFQDAYNYLKFSPIPAIPLEIALVEFYNRYG